MCFQFNIPKYACAKSSSMYLLLYCSHPNPFKEVFFFFFSKLISNEWNIDEDRWDMRCWDYFEYKTEMRPIRAQKKPQLPQSWHAFSSLSPLLSSGESVAIDQELACFTQPAIRWSERKRKGRRKWRKRLKGPQVYTSCCGGASQWKEQTSWGGYLIKEGTSSN